MLVCVASFESNIKQTNNKTDENTRHSFYNFAVHNSCSLGGYIILG